LVRSIEIRSKKLEISPGKPGGTESKWDISSSGLRLWCYFAGRN